MTSPDLAVAGVRLWARIAYAAQQLLQQNGKGDQNGTVHFTHSDMGFSSGLRPTIKKSTNAVCTGSTNTVCTENFFHTVAMIFDTMTNCRAVIKSDETYIVSHLCKSA